jgi:hypothetical protein
MKDLDLLLQILNAANAATPTIVSVIASIKSGRDAGKTDDEIQAESMAIALDTKTITEQDMQTTVSSPNTTEDPT